MEQLIQHNSTQSLPKSQEIKKLGEVCVLLNRGTFSILSIYTPIPKKIFYFPPSLIAKFSVT